MTESWQKEKAYEARRAEQLGAEMTAAIEAGDKERFEAAHTTAMRYMSKKERAGYYKRYLMKMTGRA